MLAPGYVRLSIIGVCLMVVRESIFNAIYPFSGFGSFQLENCSHTMFIMPVIALSHCTLTPHCPCLSVLARKHHYYSLYHRGALLMVCRCLLLYCTPTPLCAVTSRTFYLFMCIIDPTTSLHTES